MAMNAKTKEGIDKIKSSMIDGLLNYLHTGTFPNNSPNSYMIAYSAVHSLSDDDLNSNNHLFDFYKKTIENYVKEAHKKLQPLQNEELVNEFLTENEKCNILNYWMKRIFTYLDKFYTKNKNLGTLCTNSLKIYREILFLPLKNKLYDAVNKLIKEDRECNVIYRYKIKNLLKIIEEVDLKDPEILKENDKLIWTGTHEDQYIKEWFNGSFTKETKNYAEGHLLEAYNLPKGMCNIKFPVYNDEGEFKEDKFAFTSVLLPFLLISKSSDKIDDLVSGLIFIILNVLTLM